MSLRHDELCRRLLPWFERHGRRNLPWQRDPTPYRVWVSEVMLQQTQVETVIPYFARFVARFPEVTALAAAPLDEVLALWSGLGYYARARNLHRAAQEIAAHYDGRLPATREALVALPGIGRSTAGAILALAHGRRHAILDGNARRVLARVFVVRAPPGTAEANAMLWQLAEACTPETRVAEYTQAIMDLGATLCTRAQPACDRCPLRQGCGAHAKGLTAELPLRKRRAPRRQRRAHLVFVVRDGQVLLGRRPPQGIWGGLWAPPEFADGRTARSWWVSAFGPIAGRPRRLPVLRHAFTHFDLDIQPWVLVLHDRAIQVAEAGMRWHDPDAATAIGLPAPVTKLMAGVLAGTEKEEAADGKIGAMRTARPRGGRPRARAVPG